MKRWLFILLALLAPTLTHAQITANSCSQSDVATAIAAATTGEKVNVPAGTCSWTSLTLSKAIILSGAGQGVTIGSDQTAAGGATQSCASSGTCIDVGSASNAFQITIPSSGAIYIENFAFTAQNSPSNTCNAATLPHCITINGSWPPTGAVVFEYDTFTEIGSTFIDNFVAGGSVFSHITFNGTWNDFFMTIKDQSDTNSWTTANTLGNRDTTGLNNIYVETSAFNGGSNGVFDCDDDCRIVVRYNTFAESGGFNSHGEDSSPDGMRQFEIYDNSFLFPDPSCSEGNDSLSNINQYIWIRGASGVVYSNNFDRLYSSCWGDKPNVRTNIRGAEDDRPQGSCSMVSYPVPHQAGQDYNGTSAFTNPITYWSNVGNSGLVNGYYISESDGWNWGNPCSFTWGTFFQWGRDAVVGSTTTSSSSNGNTVELQVTGTPKSGYTAYTYPHPLVSGTVSLSPSSWNAGSVNVGTSGSPTTFTVTNNSASGMTGVSISNSGGNSGDFSIGSNTCGSTLAASSSCTFTETFTPSASGARSTTLTLTYSGGDSDSPQTAPLSGSGVTNTTAPSSVMFAGQVILQGKVIVQ